MSNTTLLVPKDAPHCGDRRMKLVCLIPRLAASALWAFQCERCGHYQTTVAQRSDDKQSRACCTANPTITA